MHGFSYACITFVLPFNVKHVKRFAFPQNLRLVQGDDKYQDFR